MSSLKPLKKGNEISEDELYNFQEEVQKMTDRYIEKTDAVSCSQGEGDHGDLIGLPDSKFLNGEPAGSPFYFDPP